MAFKLTQVDHDPFAQSSSGGYKLTQVEGDPFAADGFKDPGMMPSHSPELKASHESTAPQPSVIDRTLRQSARVISPVARPVLEFGGMAAGAALGTAAGAATGPGSIATGVVGGGLGYATGKQAADWLDVYSGEKAPPQNAVEAYKGAASDVDTGMKLEMGGRFIGAAFKPLKVAGKWVFKKIGEAGAGAGVGGAAGYAADGKKGAVEGAALGAAAGLGMKYVPKALAEKAGKTLAAALDDGGAAIYAKNAEEAAKIEEMINSVVGKDGPKFKFSLGQRSDNPTTIMLEREMTHGGNETAARMYKEQIADNNAALRTYYEKTFPGEHGVDDLITELRAQQTALKEGERTAQQAVTGAAESLPMSEPPATGQRVVEGLQGAKSQVKESVKKAYGEVADTGVDVSDMLKEFEAISKPMSKFEDPGNIPSVLSRVKESLGDATQATVSDLQGLRSELLAQSRQVRSSATPNERLASRLSQAANAVESAIAKAGDGSSQLKSANKFFKENYAQVFKQGTVGDVLRKGPRGEATRIPVEKIPDKLWSDKTGSAIKNVEKALGQEQTANIMRDYAAHDLMKTATDAEGKIVPAKLNQWYAKNRRLLGKMGIEGDFKGVLKAQEAADAASGAAKEFERSAAERLLGADPGSEIKSSIKGEKVGRAAYELMQKVKGNKAATAGLQKAFADHIINVSETTATDIAGEKVISTAALSRNVKKYKAVIDVLYRGEPEKYKAIKTVQRAYEISVRTSKSPIGGGSDTKELFSTALGKLMHFGQKAPGVKIVYDFLKGQGEKKANELISRALFDPEFADVLLQAYNRTMTPKQFNTIMNGKIVDLAKYREGRTAKAASVAVGIGAQNDNGAK